MRSDFSLNNPYYRHDQRLRAPFLQEGSVGTKYNRLRSEKVMAAYLIYEIHVLKKRKKTLLVPGCNTFYIYP